MPRNKKNLIRHFCSLFLLLLLSAGLQAAPTTITLGGWLQGIALNPATSTAYVAALGATSVTMIDMTTNTVSGQINLSLPVGNSGARLAINNQANRLYLLNFNRISIIDTNKNVWLQDITFGQPPQRLYTSDIAVNPATGTVYFSVSGSERNTIKNSLYYMNGDGTGIGSVALSQSTYSNLVAVDANNNRIYVTDTGASVVHVVDGSTKTLIGSTSAFSAKPGSITANPSTGLAYAGLQGYAPYGMQGGVVAVGVSGKSVTQNTYNFGNYINVMSDVASAQSNVVFVADYGAWGVPGTGAYMFSGATGSVIGAPFPVGLNPTSLAFNGATSTLYALGGTSNGTVTVVPVPRVDTIGPGEAGPGQTVTLGGYNFNPVAANNQVVFGGGVTATPSAATATSLTVTVPAGAVSGPVSVVTGGITSAPSAQTLTVLPAPVILSLSAYVAVPGSTLVITGANFSARAADNSVTFTGNQSVTPSKATTTSLTVTVPTAARTGPLAVTTKGMQSAATGIFTVVTISTVNSPTRLSLYSVTAGARGYVAVGDAGVTLFSVDGLNWRNPAAVTTYTLGSACYGNGTYLASSGPIGGGSGSQVVSSPDGMTWTMNKVPGISPRCAGWSPIQQFIGGISGYAADNGLGTSPDGLNWTTVTSTGNNGFGITRGTGNYLAYQNGTSVYTSPFGNQWTAHTITGATSLYQAAWSPSLGMYAAIANSPPTLSSSHDGVSWTTRRDNQGLPFLEAIARNDLLGLFIAGGRNGGLVASSDGINWSILPGTGSIKSLASNGTNFVGVGEKGSIVVLTVQ